jgi:hypothetical protein
MTGRPTGTIPVAATPSTRQVLHEMSGRTGTDQIGHDLGTVLPLRGRARSKTARKKGVHLGA